MNKQYFWTQFGGTNNELDLSDATLKYGDNYLLMESSTDITFDGTKVTDRFRRL